MLVEELIASGELEINVPESRMLSSVVDTFPEEFKSRIRRMDTQDSKAKGIV